MSEKASSLPAVPLTLEGAAVLHQMYRLRWAEWRTRAAIERLADVRNDPAWMSTIEAVRTLF